MKKKMVVLPLRINLPSGFIHATFLLASWFTVVFFSKLSNFKCSVILSNCSSLGDWLRNAATFEISPRKSWRNKTFNSAMNSPNCLQPPYLLHVFEEHEMHIGVVTFRPSVQSSIWGKNGENITIFGNTVQANSCNSELKDLRFQSSSNLGRGRSEKTTWANRGQGDHIGIKRASKGLVFSVSISTYVLNSLLRYLRLA